MVSYYISHDGLKLAYRIMGKFTGAPVICLPGITRNSTDFDYLAPHLNKYALICPDYRGRGMSDWDKDPENYNALTEAKDILQLMDLLDIGSAPIIGTSRGGIIAVIMANLAPERVLGIIFNDIGSEIERTGLKRINEYIGRKPAAKTISEAAENLKLFSEGFTGVPQKRWHEEANKHYIKTPEGLKINYDPKLREGFKQYLASGNVNLWQEFEILRHTHYGIIRGKNSDILSAETVEKMLKRFPDGMYKEVPLRGHVPFLDEWESLDLIHAFLKSHYKVSRLMT